MLEHVSDLKAEAIVSAGGALFGKLKSVGVEYVFANSGTDFPPIIEGLIEATQAGMDLPTPVTCPHEHAALGMAHGYYLMSGKMQAVILHTNVGLANGATGAINAACDNVPVLMMSGRTPVAEGGRFGARTVPIGWGQEMFDQAALVREVSKWDYELRFPEQLPGLIDRAAAIANSTPAGPVYLSLPREVLCEPISVDAARAEPIMNPAKTAVDPEALADGVKALKRAKTPLVIAQRGLGSTGVFDSFSEFVSAWALPVCQYWANRLSLAADHPMNVGMDPRELLAEADVVLVIDSLAPWWPDATVLRDDVTVIHLGPDPLFARTPVRNFRADISLAGETAETLAALMSQMGSPRTQSRMLSTRRDAITSKAADLRAEVLLSAERGARAPMTKDWVSLCLGRALKGRPATVFHELGAPLAPLGLDAHNSYFQEPFSGGLGWGFPAALGAQIAAPDRLVVATLGDGSYMFANPTACHQIAEALGLPVLVLVLNNEEWGAVRHSVEGLYQQGLAPMANEVPITSLRPSPDFTKTAEASRAYTETVMDGVDLPDALERAIRAVTEERRQALLNIAIVRDRTSHERS